MSEVKVNKISPRTNCGTTTLGDSGDTFTIPAGVTITNNGTANGFGATGAVNWQTTVKTGTFTATAGEGYFVDTTSGGFNINLPAGTAGAVVGFKDYANTFDTGNATLVQNGSDKIGGRTANATLSTEGMAVTLVFIDSTQGWLVTDSGLQSDADNNPFIVATGGTITNSGNDRIHTFTGPGTFSVTRVAACAANNVVSYIVVAGGGSGGATHGGGGGAGGFREAKSPATPYTASPLDGYPSAPNRVTVTAVDFPIAIGGGGAAPANPVQPAYVGCSGNPSTFSTITATAGGRGGGGGTGCGAPGGSAGGGGNAPPRNGGSGNTPSTSPAQGTDGGDGNSPGGTGGGGGATAAGVPGGCTNTGGNGGAGATTSITGSPVAYAGGGGGGASSGTKGCGGAGGGGDGKITPGGAACSGTANTGGGGGGGGSSGAGGAGGSGVVIIRYKVS